VKRLVVVAPNWLGDAVMALPAIADVRRGQPAASIVVAARPSVAPLFTLVGDVDEVVNLPKNGSYPLDGCDAALLLPNSFHSALMVARAGVPERWGYRTDWRAWLLTRAVPRAPAGLHQTAYYQQLVHSLGFPNGANVPHLSIRPERRTAGAGILERAGWDGRMPLVALAPGGAYGSAKRWPPAAFADLAVALAGDGMCTIVLGSPADAQTGAEVMRALAGRATVLDLVGKTDLPALAAVLVNCRALVGNDSGAAHLAAALGVNVTAVFGPTNEHLTAPVAGGQWPAAGPADDRSPITAHRSPTTDHRPPTVTVLTHPVWCRPCMLRDCPIDHRCMRGIDVPRVLDATRRML
jgi:heptosyltransferase II